MKKSRMKRWLVLGFIVVSLLCLSACGKDEPVEEIPKNQPIELDATSADSVTEFLNLYTDQLMKQESGESASTLLTEFSNGLNFSINQFSYDGNHEGTLNQVILRDNTLFVSGQEYDESGNTLPFKTIAKLYDKGLVQINTRSDKTSSSLNTNFKAATPTQTDDQKVAEALLLKPEDIATYQESTMYLLKPAYIRRVVEALEWTDNDVSMLGLTLEQFCNLNFALDFGNYSKNHSITLSVSGESLGDNISVTFDLSEWYGQTGKTLISADLSSMTLNIALNWKDDGIFEANVEIALNETDMSIDIDYVCDNDAEPLPGGTPYKDCDDTKLYVAVKIDGEERLTLTLSASELQENRYAGTFTLSLHSELGDGLIPVALTETDEGSLDGFDINGTFCVGFGENGALTTLTSQMKTEVGGEKLSLQLDTNLENAKKVGGEVLKMKLTFDRDSVQNSMLFTVTTTSYSTSSTLFSLKGIMETDGQDEASVTATIKWPATEEIPLGTYEAELLARTDSMFEKYDLVMEKATEINEKAIYYVKNKMRSSDPLKYYYFDEELNQYFFTDISIVNNQAFVNTQCLQDYKELLYFYSKHSGSFLSYNASESMIAAYKLQTLINNSYSGYSVSYNPDYLVCQYLPEKDLYMVMLANKPSSAQFYTERVTQDVVDGYVLHEVAVLEDGTVTVHNFETLPNDSCTHTLACKDCGLRMFSIEPVHSMSPEIEIREQDRVTFSICENCKEGYLTMTDKNGTELRVFLSPHDKRVTTGKRYGEDALVIDGFDHLSSEASYNGSLNIPDIEPKTGYLIVGAVYNSTRSALHCELTLPEGVEFIGYNAFKGCGFTAINLPSSLKTIGGGAFKGCRATEIVIPAGVTYVDFDALSMPSLKKITVNAIQLDVFVLPRETPLLSEFICNGTILRFVGNDEYSVETLIIPEGVVTVSGFNRNNNIKKVVLPSTLTTVERDAFEMCESLEEVVIPSGLKSIGMNAFSGCTSLVRIRINGEDSTESEDGVFSLPSTLESLGSYAFARCTSLKSISIPLSISVIPVGLFEYCTSLTAVELHSSITEISPGAFKTCVKLSSLTMPEGLISIGSQAFNGCSSLVDANVVFGSRLQKIEEGAFGLCVGIRNIILPESVTSVGSHAFDRCQLDTVYVSGKLNIGENWSATIGEITLAKGFTGNLPVAGVINIMSTEVPEGIPHMFHHVSSIVSVINFAGSKEAWEMGNYILSSATQINYNVVF